VTPIHVPTNTAGPPIQVGNRPVAIVVTPNGKTAYVSNQDGWPPTRRAPPFRSRISRLPSPSLRTARRSTRPEAATCSSRSVLRPIILGHPSSSGCHPAPSPSPLWDGNALGKGEAEFNPLSQHQHLRISSPQVGRRVPVADFLSRALPDLANAWRPYGYERRDM
jgi:DNA-binding beta-propeller fold protein YncE